jgi:plasmid stabilization system protein ParE
MSRRRRFVVTPEARADLIEIWNYIAEDSIDAADQAIARLDDAFRRLGQRREWAITRKTGPTHGTVSGRLIHTSSPIVGRRRPYRSSPSYTGHGARGGGAG